MIDYIAALVSFFAVIDPIGTVPVFIAVTKQFDDSQRRAVALKAALVAGGVLVFFVVAGQPILSAMSIPLAAFQIAGGIVLFLFALTMIFGESKPEEEIRCLRNHGQTAVFPLAVPSLASPGAMLAAVLMTDNDQFNIFEQLQTAGVMLAVLTLAYVLMLASAPVNRMIGESGATVVSRVMGLLLSSVATTNVLSGIKWYFGI